MLKVTLEICPPRSTDRSKRTIATLEISIAGQVRNTTHGELADYDVSLKDEEGRLLNAGVVEKHIRSLGPLPLIQRAIESLRRSGRLPLEY